MVNKDYHINKQWRFCREGVDEWILFRLTLLDVAYSNAYSLPHQTLFNYHDDNGKLSVANTVVDADYKAVDVLSV